MANKNKSDQRPKTGNPWNHYRAKLVRRAEAIVLGGRSNDTVGDLQSDYKPLVWSLRELEQYVSQRRSQQVTPTVEDVKKVFCDQHILVGDGAAPGYATDADLEEFLKGSPAPGKFAKDLMVRRWGMTLSTIETNLKPHRKKK